MARRLDHLPLDAADLDRVAFLDLSVDGRDRAGLLGWAENGAAGHALNDGVAGGMVVMMVGREDVRQHPALVVQRGEQLLGVRRIDRCGRLARRVVDQDAVIVAAGRELMNSQFGHGRFQRSFLLSAETVASPCHRLNRALAEVANEL